MACLLLKLCLLKGQLGSRRDSRRKKDKMTYIFLADSDEKVIVNFVKIASNFMNLPTHKLSVKVGKT